MESRVEIDSQFTFDAFVFGLTGSAGRLTGSSLLLTLRTPHLRYWRLETGGETLDTGD